MDIPATAITGASYVVVAAATLLGATTWAALQIGRRVGKLAGTAAHLAGPMVGALLVWSGIIAAWRLVEGGRMPLALLLAAYVWAGMSAVLHGVGRTGMLVAAAEQIGIILATVGGWIATGGVRWI